MSDMDDVFGSDSSADEFDPKDAQGEEGGALSGDALEDSDLENDAPPSPAPAAGAGAGAGVAAAAGGGTGGAGSAQEDDPLADSDSDDEPSISPVQDRGDPSVMGGTGLSDSEEEEDTLNEATKAVDDDLFGSDSDSGAEAGPRRGATGVGAGGAAAGVDPFEDSDDEDAGGKGGDEGGKSLGRLSKGGGSSSSKKGKGKKRKADDGDLDEEGGGKGGSLKKAKGKKKADKLKKKKSKKKKSKSKGGGEEGEEGGEDGGQVKIKKKKTKKKKKKKKASSSSSSGGGSSNSQQMEDLGLASSADEDGQDGNDDDEEEEEADLEPEEVGVLDNEGGEGEGEEARKRADAAFIDDADDNADLLEEYNHDAPAPGSDSEAEEDNSNNYHDDAPTFESPMNAVLKSMKRRKAQDLSTAEREQIAQEFMFKINQAAEDDEEAVSAGRPALNKLKMLKMVKATLAKKELQETFLEFDLLGVVKRWLQPYSNGQLPNLTIRKEMLALVLNLPVQIDHLKRSGIGKIVMGLLNCREETKENKIMLRELVSRWNRPVYEKETNYRAMRSMHDEPEAMEVGASGSRGNSHGGRRRVAGSMSQRDGPSKDEAVGNILNARARGLDPSKSRVPFSVGYAFAKAPRSRVEGHGRSPPQQVDTSARSKLLKKMAVLSRPINKNA